MYDVFINTKGNSVYLDSYSDGKADIADDFYRSGK